MSKNDTRHEPSAGALRATRISLPPPTFGAPGPTPGLFVPDGDTVVNDLAAALRDLVAFDRGIHGTRQNVPPHLRFKAAIARARGALERYDRVVREVPK